MDMVEEFRWSPRTKMLRTSIYCDSILSLVRMYHSVNMESLDRLVMMSGNLLYSWRQLCRPRKVWTLIVHRIARKVMSRL